MTTFAEIAEIVKINETDQAKVNSIKASISNGTFEAPALLIWEDMNQAVTGSHRIEAIRQLVEDDEDQWENEEIDTIDVSDVMAEIECPDYAGLKSMFAGTEYETDARQNLEW